MDINFDDIIKFISKIMIPLLVFVVPMFTDKNKKNKKSGEVKKEVVQKNIKNKDKLKANNRENNENYTKNIEKNKKYKENSRISEKQIANRDKKIFDDVKKTDKIYYIAVEDKNIGYQSQKKFETIKNDYHEVDKNQKEKEVFDVKTAILYSEILQKPLSLRR